MNQQANAGQAGMKSAQTSNIYLEKNNILAVLCSETNINAVISESRMRFLADFAHTVTKP